MIPWRPSLRQEPYTQNSESPRGLGFRVSGLVDALYFKLGFACMGLMLPITLTASSKLIKVISALQKPENDASIPH